MNIRMIGLLCTMFLFSLVGCTDDKPVVTLKVTDCPVEDIEMNEKITVSGSQTTRRWIVSVEVTVECDGNTIEGAEFAVKYPWLPAFKRKTGNKGYYKISKKIEQYDRPTGSIDVTIKGSDDSKTIPVSF